MAIALVAAGAVFLALDAGDSPTAPLDAEDQQDDQRSAPTLLAGGTRPTDTSKSTKASTQEANGEGGAEEEAAPAHRVEGVITGPTAEQMSAATVRVRLLGSFDWVNTGHEPARARPDEHGRFAVDVGALRKQVPSASRIQVSVDHPSFVVARVKLDLAPLEDGVTRVGEPIQMRRAFRIPVIVHGPGGNPVAGADVVLVAMRHGKIVLTDDEDPVVIDAGATDAKGRVTLRAAGEGQALLAANLEGHVPASQQLAISEREIQAHVLTLESACSVSGTVSLNGMPLPGAEMQASAGSGNPWLDFDRFYARRIEGRLLPADMEGTSDANGSFTITGLAPGTHRIEVNSVEGYRIWQKSNGATHVETDVPGTGVHVDLAMAVVKVQVLSEGKPLKGAHVRMSQPKKGSSGRMTDETGLLQHLVPAGETLEFRIEHDDHEKDTALEVGPLAIAEIVEKRVDLGPARAKGTLVVVLTDEDGKPVTKAGIRITDEEDGRLAHFDPGLGVKRSKDGIYRIEDVRVGKATLVVTPNRGGSEYRGRYLLLDAPVTVHADRETRVELVARRGARVFLTVKDDAGKPIEASATLRDGRGEEVDVSYFWADGNSATMSSGSLGATRTTIEPPLAPGSYEVEISSSGYADRRVPFVVEADTDKELVVQLQKE